MVGSASIALSLIKVHSRKRQHVSLRTLNTGAQNELKYYTEMITYCCTILTKCRVLSRLPTNLTMCVGFTYWSVKMAYTFLNEGFSAGTGLEFTLSVNNFYKCRLTDLPFTFYILFTLNRQLQNVPSNYHNF